MSPGERPTRPSKADWYRFDDGTQEIVFAVEDGSVLSVREYQDFDTFYESVAPATYLGEHDHVEELPEVSAFESDDSSSDA